MTKLRDQDAERRHATGLGRDHSEALARGLQILTLFNESRRSQTLSELAALVDLPRATVRRALLTLEALGYVASEGRHFHLTPRVLRLADGVSDVQRHLHLAAARLRPHRPHCRRILHGRRVGARRGRHDRPRLARTIGARRGWGSASGFPPIAAR